MYTVFSQGETKECDVCLNFFVKLNTWTTGHGPEPAIQTCFRVMSSPFKRNSDIPWFSPDLLVQLKIQIQIQIKIQIEILVIDDSTQYPHA